MPAITPSGRISPPMARTAGRCKYRSTTAGGRTAPCDLTWQASDRNKINFFTDYQRICQHCIQGGSSSGLTFAGTIASPEALQRVENRPNSMTQFSWTSPVTSRLLLEANAQLGPYFWWGGTQKNSYDPP